MPTVSRPIGGHQVSHKNTFGVGVPRQQSPPRLIQLRRCLTDTSLGMDRVISIWAVPFG